MMPGARFLRDITVPWIYALFLFSFPLAVLLGLGYLHFIKPPEPFEDDEPDDPVVTCTRCGEQYDRDDCPMCGWGHDGI